MPAPAHLLLMGRQASGWTPAELPSLELWLDADDAGSFTYSSGVVVSGWDDLSGQGNHLTQATGSRQPSRNGTQNGRDTVVFDGGDWLSATVNDWSTSSSLTILAVAKLSNTTQAGAGVVNIGSGAGGSGGWTTCLKTWNAGSYGVVANWIAWRESAVAPDTNLTNMAMRWTTGTNAIKIYKNGSDVGGYITTLPSANDNNIWSVGAFVSDAYGMVGEIAEVAVCLAALSDADLVLWDDYCSSKWGTP